MQHLRKGLSAVVMLTMLTVLFYGLYRFPDAPIHPCSAQQYCGKQGQPHTPEDYIAFKRWESTLTWLWPPGMLVLFLLNRKKVIGSGLSGR
jgi:hypothetical protein